MGYKHIVFDIDGTLADTEYSILQSLQRMVKEIKNIDMDTDDLRFALGITGTNALDRLEITNQEEALRIWVEYMNELSNTVSVFSGIRELLDTLRSRSCHLGIISSQYREEFDRGFIKLGLTEYFDTVVLGDDTQEHKPTPAPMECYIRKSGADPAEILYIGDSPYDMMCAHAAGTHGGLAVWGCNSRSHIPADYYFEKPQDVADMLMKDQLEEALPWLTWAKELQFIAQAGITYSKDAFDIERFERIREISADIMCMKTGYSKEHVKEVFCNETGFQTPKMDTRAAVFKDGKILLVKERDDKWSLPGGWVDVNQSIKTNTVKEVKEEAGLDVVPERLIAVQDRNLHNLPQYAYGICKVFVQCRSLGGEFVSNIETQECLYFGLDELPQLAEEKVSLEQIRLCFQAYESPSWVPLFD